MTEAEKQISDRQFAIVGAMLCVPGLLGPALLVWLAYRDHGLKGVALCLVGMAVAVALMAGAHGGSEESPQ